MRKLLALGALALVTGVSHAQLVTPPTEAPPASEPVTLPPDTAPAAPAAQPGFRPQPVAPAPEPLPPYESIVKRDAQGKVIRLTELPDVAALKNNPLVNDDQRKKAAEYLAERRHSFEQIIIENLDIAEDLAGPRLEKIKIAERGDELKWLNAAIKPFSVPGSISGELNKRGIIDARAMQLNQKISKEYSSALTADMTQGDKSKLLDNIGIMIRDQAVSEPLAIRRDMLIEASNKLGAILPKLGLSSDVLSKAQGATKLATNADDNARVAAMESLKDILSLDQRKEMLRQVIAMRAK